MSSFWTQNRVIFTQKFFRFHKVFDNLLQNVSFFCYTIPLWTQIMPILLPQMFHTLLDLLLLSLIWHWSFPYMHCHMGILSYYMNALTLILLSIFLIVMLLSRMVSLGSICAATAMPFSVLFLYWGQSYAWSLVLITGLMAAGLIFRHTSNVRRILAGTENKIFSKKK